MSIPSLYLRHSSFSHPSVGSPTSQFIIQPFFRFSYVTSSSRIHLASRPCVILYSNSIDLLVSKILIAWAACQVMKVKSLILQPSRHFTYATAHSPTLPSLYLRHSLFSNPSVSSPTSQLILQPFFRFSYFTGFSLTSPGEPPMLVNGK